MSEYYHLHPEAYHEATFHIDPASFLWPLPGSLPARSFQTCTPLACTGAT